MEEEKGPDATAIPAAGAASRAADIEKLLSDFAEFFSTGTESDAGADADGQNRRALGKAFLTVFREQLDGAPSVEALNERLSIPLSKMRSLVDNVAHSPQEKKEKLQKLASDLLKRLDLGSTGSDIEAPGRKPPRTTVYQFFAGLQPDGDEEADEDKEALGAAEEQQENAEGVRGEAAEFGTSKPTENKKVGASLSAPESTDQKSNEGASSPSSNTYLSRRTHAIKSSISEKAANSKAFGRHQRVSRKLKRNLRAFIYLADAAI